MSDLDLVAASFSSMDLEDQDSERDADDPKIEGFLLWVLKTKKFCDVIFTFPNLPDRIEAHEFCLKARSPVFEQILRMRKSGNVQGNEIEISECTPERFQQFLEFIYSDKFEVDIGGALDLLLLSLQYKVHPLTQKCEELLLTEIPMLDSVTVFETARRHDRRELMDRAGPIMVKSFLKLVRAGALAKAEEETLAYILESDDLAVEEVGLFQFIVDWGRNQVGTSADEELLKNKLKNLILKIRYTNMAPEDFTKVVLTGLLSAEESLSVYTYLCADEVTRGGLKTKFNTTRRKERTKEMLTTKLDVCAYKRPKAGRFPVFSKHCLSFKADGEPVDGKVLPDYFQKNTVIKAICFQWPFISPGYRRQLPVLNINVTIREYSGPVEGWNSKIRFQEQLLNCSSIDYEEVSLEPPVELVSGSTYSITVEDNTTFEPIDSFRMDKFAYSGVYFGDMNRDAKVGFEDFSVTLKEMQSKTDYNDWRVHNVSEEPGLIAWIQFALV